MRNIRRQHLEQKRKVKQLIFYTIGILLFIYLTLSLIIGDSGLIRYTRLKSMRDGMIAEINTIRKRNEETKRELERKENDQALMEELAREHGLAKDGELIFKFEDE
jgi:cell division protein FtsB